MKKYKNLRLYIVVLILLSLLACASKGKTNTQPAANARPVWIDRPDAVYDRANFLSAVGSGVSREIAEKDALGKLSAIFGQNIQVDSTTSETYFEALRNGVITEWVDDFAHHSTVRTRSSLNELIGAEIRDVWNDPNGHTVYAVAVLVKARAASIYRDRIEANQKAITDLTRINHSERNTLIGFSRYHLAATLADINIQFGNVLSVLGTSHFTDITPGTVYRNEAHSIATTIPVSVRVDKDRSNRVNAAFVKALSELGFQSGGNNSPYIVDVLITLSPVENPGQTNKFVRMELTANLIDTATNQQLLTWGFNERQGHLTLSEAENRIFGFAERKIATEYRDFLSAYMTSLIK
jgi:hypothetical protein